MCVCNTPTTSDAMRAIPPNTQAAQAVIYVQHDTIVNTTTIKLHAYREKHTPDGRSNESELHRTQTTVSRAR